MAKRHSLHCGLFFFLCIILIFWLTFVIYDKLVLQLVLHCNAFIWEHTRTHTHTHARTHAHTDTHILQTTPHRTHTRTTPHTHTRTHARTHTHTHTHARLTGGTHQNREVIFDVIFLFKDMTFNLAWSGVFGGEIWLPLAPRCFSLQPVAPLLYSMVN